MTEQTERERVVSYLRNTPLETTGPLLARIRVACWWIFNPQKAHRSGWKVAAKYIERGEHMKGAPDD